MVLSTTVGTGTTRLAGGCTDVTMIASRIMVGRLSVMVG